MKEFAKTNNITYNLVSYTGFKSLLLFSLLRHEAKTYDEMKEFFRNNEYLKEELSEDTLRVYLTSLKRVGCVISRHSTPNGSKFKIVSHPYEFKVSENQIKAIVKIYRVLVQVASIKDILSFDNFILNIAEQIESEELKNAIQNVSIFKNINKELLSNLIKYTNEKFNVKLLYDSPNSGLKEISIITDSIKVEKNHVYLYGINLEYSQESLLLMSRIKKIINAEPHDDNLPVNLETYTVGYELSTLVPNIKLENNETIAEIKDDSVIIEAQTTNLFMMKRRILELGPLCTVLYPDNFRKDIIDTLRSMKEEYLHDEK